MRIKVLVISDYRDYHSTRPEASIFKGLQQEGMDVRIMTHPGSGHKKEFQELGIEVIEFHPTKKFDKGEIQRIRQYLLDEKIDILHLFNGPAIINGIQAAKKLPVKIVLYRGYTGNIHWYDPADYFKFLHPRVDKIFCNSKGVEELLHRQLFFKKDKAITINKGHDVTWYEGYTPIDIRKELNIPTDSFLFINVANNRKMKGIPYLLKAFNQLTNMENVHLLLAGKRYENEENLGIIRAGNKQSQVHFLGHRKDVLNVVAACDCFVLSSIFGESITKSVIEAMSLGVPPIITDIPGNVELVDDGESGRVVPAKHSDTLAQAMKRMVEEVSLRKEMGQAAKEHIATKLNHLQTIEKTKKMYEDLLEN